MQCPLCREDTASWPELMSRTLEADCHNCGKFRLTFQAKRELASDEETAFYLASWVFEQNKIGVIPRIDRKEHDGKIDDQIIAEIRRSAFVVADFSGHRGGVYYEAGFAHGIGRRVIFTCKQAEIDKLHFDIRQYNTILWTTPNEIVA